ncbi:MAG TPA: DMT family transporter [Myxococcaceae bacterium]|nr:DMT family transporter [Myxococcaceae bacterium]
MSSAAHIPSRRADAVLVAITAFWGVTFVVVKDAVGLADPFTFLALRFGLGAALLTAVAWRGVRGGALLRAGAGLGMLLFVGFAAQTAGLQFTTPSRSAFLTGLSVLLVPFLAIAFHRHRPPPASLVGVALAVVGLWALAGADRAPGAPPDLWKGDALTLLCALAFALHITLIERMARVHPPAPLVAVQLGTVAVIALAAMAALGPRLVSTPALWSAVLITGAGGSAVALLLQAWAQARTTAVRAALVFALEPVFAAAYSVALGREELRLREVGGGGLIVLGVLVSELGPAGWTGLVRLLGREGRGARGV